MVQLTSYILAMISLSTIISAEVPSVELNNAADADLRMPAVGLGTFGYSHGGDPEVWNYTTGFNTALQWFNLGGKRWDSAHSYKSVQGVADGLLNVTNSWSTTPRSDIFITQKIGGGGNTLGYNSTLQQFEELLLMFNTTYFDLLLIHWPSLPDNRTSNDSSDSVCNSADSRRYNPTLCRQITWKAMEQIYNGYKLETGEFVRARSIGVSNFEKTHLMDIFNLNGLLPAVNQIEFHGYWHELDLVEYCQNYNIMVNSYAPLGAPDVTVGEWMYILPEHPVVVGIGEKYGKSAAQVLLNWGWRQNIVFNPRSENVTHMKENMEVFDFELNQEEMLMLASLSNEPMYPKNKVCPDPNTCP